MKKEYLIKATIALAVLILAFSIPVMVSSLPEAQSKSLVKSNQTTFISEYQPVCPEESYNKIAELHAEGLSEEKIAEELAFPLDIVNRYLEGNYTYVKTSSTYDEPPGMKEYVPPKEPLPKSTPPVEQDQLIMTQEQESPAQSNASLNSEDLTG